MLRHGTEGESSVFRIEVSTVDSGPARSFQRRLGVCCVRNRFVATAMCFLFGSMQQLSHHVMMAVLVMRLIGCARTFTHCTTRPDTSAGQPLVNPALIARMLQENTITVLFVSTKSKLLTRIREACIGCSFKVSTKACMKRLYHAANPI